VPNTGGLKTGDVYRTMRDAGVDMTVGQGGQGPVARHVEDFAANTPGGANRSAKFRMKQQGQMSDAMTRILDQIDPTGAGKDISDQGALIQRALESSQDVAHSNASDAFKNTLSPLFDYSTANTADIAQAARDMKAKLQTGEIKSMHPDMIKMLDEIDQGYGDQHNNQSMFDAVFRDRSRLMKSRFTDANVAGENEAVARQMAGVMRDSLAKSAAAAGKLDDFNQAMKGWQDYHDTYGDRSSPIVRALNEADPSRVIDKFLGGKGSPRAVEMLKKAAPDFVNVLKREFVRRLFDSKDTGVGENYGNMQNKLLQYNEPFLKSLFTPDEVKQLRALSAGARSINTDINPPGSGRYGSQTLTGAAIGSGVTGGGVAALTGHPVAGAIAAGGAAAVPVGANIASRVMQSRPIADFFMGYEPPGTTAAAPGATGAVAPGATAAPGGRAVANPFVRTGSSGRRNSQRGSATTEALAPGFGWLIDKILGDNPSKQDATALVKQSKKVDSALSFENTFKTAEKIAKLHNDNGGSTYHLAQGDLAGKDAFAVSIFPELSHTVEGEKVTPEAIDEFITRPEVQAALKSDPRISVGTWASDGKTTLDLVATPSDLGAARKLGAAYNQKAIFDLQHMREINTGGTGEGSPEGMPAPEARLKDVKNPDPLDATHYSREEGLSELDPTKFGANATAEKKIAQAFPDKYQPVSFLGERTKYRASNEREITGRPNRYAADLNSSRYYDVSADPDGVIQQALTKANAEGNYGNEALQAYLQQELRQRGYSGTINGQSGVITSWDKVPVNKEIIPEWADRLITPQERSSLRSDYLHKAFTQTLSNLPPVKEWVDAAKAGEVGRKWYQRSGEAFDALAKAAPDYFSEGDREKFTDLVAATSPQQGVTQNLREALSAWKKWNDADRPTKASEIRELLDPELTNGPSKLPNAIKALTGQDMFPELPDNRYFKVPNFAKNLRGLMNNVTNDSWMGLFSGIVKEADIARSQNYHPVSVMTRAAAKELGWEPAEAQAAIWVFTRTLGEMAEKKDVTTRSALGNLTDEKMKAYADDFADIMRNDPQARSLMKQLGVDLGTLDEKLGAIGHPEVASGAASITPDNLGRTADRIAAGREARATGGQPVGAAGDKGKIEAKQQASPREIVQFDTNHIDDLKSWGSVSVGDGQLSSRATDAVDVANGMLKSIARKKTGEPPKWWQKENSETKYFASQRDGKTVGAIQIDTYGADRGLPLHVDYLTVHPDVILGNIQEKGIGTELMGKAISEASRLGVGIELKAKGGAKSFYSQLGMKLKTGLDDRTYYLTADQVKRLSKSSTVQK
jgi:hypothetical protein